MRLSIIIVNWNGKTLLCDCLESLLPRIDDEQVEVIVVDNGSSDGSPERIASEFPHVELISNPDNRGFAAANNQGFRIARGEYVLLLNNDTLVHGTVIADSCEYLDNHADVAVMGCRVLNSDGSLQLTCSQFPSFLNLTLLTSGLWKLPWPRFLGRYQMQHWERNDERNVDTVSGCYMMVRRSAIDEVGVLDERFFFFGEETDWCLRFRQIGWGVVFAPVGNITHFGSVSARRHNHKLDIMLSNAMVKLHEKHHGKVSAIAIWLLLFFFNASRACYWYLKSSLVKNADDRERCRHFSGVVKGFVSIWPHSLPGRAA